MKRKLFSCVLIAAIIFGSFCAFVTHAALNTTDTLLSTGLVSASPGLATYSDASCTVPLSTINWGSLALGQNVTQTFYMKNTGSLSLTLNLTVSDWLPTNANQMSIVWNREGVRVAPNVSGPVTLTLVVPANITDVTNFSVQIHISGTN